MSGGLHVKYSSFLSDFNELEFSRQISTNTQMSNLMKIRPVESELFHADRRSDGRTDITKLIAAFRNFANAPKNE
jgi:hypothetical protein